MKKWEKISEETIHKNPWWTYKHDKYVLPNGKEGDYYYVFIVPGATIIPVLNSDGEDKKIIMIKQFRYLSNKYSIEFPMGGKKEGQTIEECALAELEEETGYKAKKIELIGNFFPYEGLAKDVSNIFIAENLQKTEAKPDESEEIEILIKTPKEIDVMIGNGEILSGQMIAAWHLAKNKI